MSKTAALISVCGLGLVTVGCEASEIVFTSLGLVFDILNIVGVL